MKLTADRPRECRVCGCTDADCSGCIRRTGEPCHWIEDDLCSACELMRNDVWAVSVLQPWAELIAAGCKPFEFRGDKPWARLIGKRIAIQAMQPQMKRIEIATLINRLSTADWRATGLSDRGKSLDILEKIWRLGWDKGRNEALPLGHIVCTAILGQPIRNEELAAALGIPWVNDSDRDEHSNWGWPLTEIERVDPPVRATGKQGFWRWLR